MGFLNALKVRSQSVEFSCFFNPEVFSLFRNRIGSRS